MKMAKTVVIIATLDTKGEETRYIKELIEKRGHKTIVIDTSMLGEASFPPDISRDEVAEAAGTRMKEIIALANEAKANAVMAEGASKIVQELHSSQRLDGIISAGGTMGTSLGISVMKALPLGVPKLMVSTVACTPLITPEMVSKDLTLMQLTVDIWGRDRMTERILKKAAGAIVGMVEAYEEETAPSKPLIGITTLGTAGLKYVWHIRPLLQQRGYEVAVFHAVGIGGQTFEQFIEQGLIAGALDLCAHELINYLCGGFCDAGAERMEAAGRKGIPQVVAPGVVGTISWRGSLSETLPPRFRKRTMHQHNLLVGGVKASKREMAAVGKLMAEKLNKATGPTAVVIPSRGFDERDRPGSPFYEPQGRKAFIQALKENLKPEVKIVELDVHINDPQFATEVVAIFDELMQRQAEKSAETLYHLSRRSYG
jgi:uncharacterized protein (UPF0261 family)